MSLPDNSKALTVEINLDFPILIGGVPTSTLTLRRPKVADQKARQLSKKSDAESEMDLFANLLQITPAELLELDMADYGKISEAYISFFPQPTAS